MAITRPAIATPRGESDLLACDNPTYASTMDMIPGIIATKPIQGITAITNVMIAVIRAAIPSVCPEFLFTSSIFLIVLF